MIRTACSTLSAQDDTGGNVVTFHAASLDGYLQRMCQQRRFTELNRMRLELGATAWLQHSTEGSADRQCELCSCLCMRLQKSVEVASIFRDVRQYPTEGRLQSYPKITRIPPSLYPMFSVFVQNFQIFFEKARKLSHTEAFLSQITGILLCICLFSSLSQRNMTPFSVCQMLRRPTPQIRSVIFLNPRLMFQSRTSASRLTAYSSSQQTAASHAADACAAMACASPSRSAAL